MGKNLSAMQKLWKTQVQSLGWLGRSLGGGNGNPVHSLAWRLPCMEEPGGLQSLHVAESKTRLNRLSMMQAQPKGKRKRS